MECKRCPHKRDKKECPVCYGEGEYEGHTKEGIYITCPSCNGKGWIRV